MEQCEGCHTLILIQSIQEDLRPYCTISRLIELKILTVCPCADCIVKCMCNDPCPEYKRLVNQLP